MSLWLFAQFIVHIIHFFKIVFQFRFGNAPAAVSAHFQVFPYGQLGEDAPAFGHIGNAPGNDFMGFHVADIFALIDDGALADGRQRNDGTHQGGFARAVCADYGYDLAGVQLDGHIIEGLDLSIIGIDMINL